MPKTVNALRLISISAALFAVSAIGAKDLNAAIVDSEWIPENARFQESVPNPFQATTHNTIRIKANRIPRPLFEDWKVVRKLEQNLIPRNILLCGLNQSQPSTNPFSQNMISWEFQNSWFALNPTVNAQFNRMHRLWTITGKSSTPINGLSANIAQKLLSTDIDPTSNAFSIKLSDKELINLLEGTPLSLQLSSACSQDSVSRLITVNPRLNLPTNQPDLRIRTQFKRQRKNGYTSFQSILENDTKYNIKDIYTDDDADLSYRNNDDNSFSVKISPEGVLQAADIEDDQIYFSFWDQSGSSLHRTASLQLDIAEEDEFQLDSDLLDLSADLD